MEAPNLLAGVGPTKGPELPGERMVPRGVRNFQDPAGHSQSIPAEQGFWYAHVVWAHDWAQQERLASAPLCPKGWGHPAAGGWHCPETSSPHVCMAVAGRPTQAFLSGVFPQRQCHLLKSSF